jgi:DNA-binding transcriptional LysR family regulator
MVIFQKEQLESGFSLDRLRSLLEVHEAGYIAKASRDDRTRANLISRQITELEEFFGTKLRKKEGRQAKLSEDGEELAKLTKRFLRQLEEYQDRVEGRPETINLGTGNTIIEIVLLPKLSDIRKQANGAMVMLRNRRSRDIIDQLNSGELHIGIVSETRLPSSLDSKPLGQVSFELFIPSTLKAKANFKDPLKTMSELPYASLDGSGETKTAITDAARKRKLTIRPELECSGSGQVAAAIKNGNFCGILPSFFNSYFEKDQVHRVKIPRMGKLNRKYVVAWLPSAMKIREKPISGAVDSISEIFRAAVK